MSSLRDDSAAPSRDLLGQACFWLHIAVLVYIVGGWALPQRQALYFYLGFLPAMVLHWRLNGNSCVLNNLESWLRGGSWRDPANREEGQWFLTLVRSVTGLALLPWQADAISYGALLLLWGLGLWHLLGR